MIAFLVIVLTILFFLASISPLLVTDNLRDIVAQED